MLSQLGRCQVVAEGERSAHRRCRFEEGSAAERRIVECHNVSGDGETAAWRGACEQVGRGAGQAPTLDACHPTDPIATGADRLAAYSIANREYLGLRSAP